MKPDIRAIQLTVITLCFLLVLIFYYPFVYLPFTFTFSNLPPQNIPFYLDNQLWPWSWFASAGLYGVFWFVLALDAGLLVLLGIAFAVIYLEERRENNFLRAKVENPEKFKGDQFQRWTKQSTLTWGMWFLLGVSAVVQFFRVAYFFVIAFVSCDQVQFCRLTSLQKSQNSYIPNGNFVWLIAAHVLFEVIIVSYLVVFLNIPQEQKLKQQQQQQKKSE